MVFIVEVCKYNAKFDRLRVGFNERAAIKRVNGLNYNIVLLF